MKHRIIAFFYEYRNPIGLALGGACFIASAKLIGLN